MQKIFNIFSNFFKWISDSFNSFFDWINSFFSKIWSFFSDILYWFIDLFRDYINNSLNPLVDSVPDLSPMWNLFSMISPYYYFANEWVALDFAFVCLAGYLLFLSVMIPVKLIVKLFIPFVG